MISPALVAAAVRQGAFPMTDDDGRIEFFVAARRGLLPIDGIRVSRSLAKTIRQGRYEVTFDRDFEGVMRGCLRSEEEGNWISEPIIRAYTEIHRQGWAHSVEAWAEGALVGGAYGLALGGCFSAESMFHRATDASKVALEALVRRCRALGFVLFDTQLLNDHLETLGGFEVSAEEYLRRLRAAQRIRTPWGAPP